MPVGERVGDLKKNRQAFLWQARSRARFLEQVGGVEHVVQQYRGCFAARRLGEFHDPKCTGLENAAEDLGRLHSHACKSDAWACGNSHGDFRVEAPAFGKLIGAGGVVVSLRISNEVPSGFNGARYATACFMAAFEQLEVLDLAEEKQKCF
jgi:hypothetical protein